KLAKDGALGVVGLDGLRNPLDRPVRQTGGLSAAEIGFDASSTSGAASVSTASGAPPSVATRVPPPSDRGLRAATAQPVSAEHAVVEVIVGVGPKRVIRIWIESVIDEIGVGVRPKQRADPADHDRVRKMPTPLRVEDAALKRRARERARAGIAGGNQVGKSLVAQHTAGEGAGVAGRTRAGCRRWNDPVHLILRNHAGLPSHVLLCRRSRAGRLILLD